MAAARWYLRAAPKGREEETRGRKDKRVYLRKAGTLREQDGAERGRP